MIGSEKQIKWANEIKDRFINEVLSIDKTEYSKRVNEIEDYESFIEDYSFETFRKMIELISKVERAEIWINNLKDEKNFIDRFINDSSLYSDDEDWADFLNEWRIK